MAHRPAARARGAVARRQRETAAPHERGSAVLGRGVRSVVPHLEARARRGGAGAVSRGEDPRPGVAFVRHHPGAVERHHGAVQLLPGQRPRPARVRAGGLATALPREAGRDPAVLLLDGGADGRPDPDGVRRHLPGRPAVHPLRRAGDPAHARAPGRGGQRRHADPGEPVPRAPHPRSALDRRPRRGRRIDPAAATDPPRAARPSRRLPQSARLPRGAAHTDLAVPSQRMGDQRHHGLPPPRA